MTDAPTTSVATTTAERILVGREQETTTIRRVLGCGGSVLVVGAAGIGKTTLVRHALEDHPGPVLFGRGVDFLDRVAYLPLATVLGRPPRPGDPAAVADELAAAVGDGVLWLDDLHWADRDTIDCLAYLPRHCPFVATTRRLGPAEASLVTGLAGLVEVVELAPLADDDARALFRQRAPSRDPAAADAATRRAGGHPLTIELLAAGEPTTTTERDHLLRALIEQLGERERVALVELAWGVGEVSGEELAALSERGVLRSGPEGTVVPLNDVLVELSLASLPEPVQRRLHIDAASRSEDPAAAVSHLVAADRRDDAFEAAVLAARRTSGRIARAELLEVAARTAPAGARSAAFRDAASELLRVGRSEQAWSLARELFDDPSTLPALDRVVLLALEARLALEGDDVAGARALIDEARTHLDDADPLTAYHLHTLHAAALMASFDLSGGLDACREAIALATRHGLRSTRARSLETGMRAMLGDASGFVDEVHRLLGEAVDDPEPQIAFDLASRAAHAGRLGLADVETAELLDRMRWLADRIGHRSWLLECDAITAFHDAFADLGAPKVRRALRDLLHDPAVATQHPSLAAVLAVAEADHGAMVTASAVLDEIRARTTSPADRRSLEWADTEIAWLSGQPTPRTPDRSMGARDLVSPLAPAAAVTRRWLAWRDGEPVGSLPFPVSLHPATRGLPLEAEGVELLSVPGREAAAAAVLLDAADHHDAYLRRNALRCRWAAAEALVRDGSPEEALRLLRELERTCEQEGLGPWTERIRASLRRLGQRAAPAPRRAGVLTARQAEVLSLVAEGMSTPAIAARLQLTTRTVDTHITTAMRSLGARTRREAVALAAEHLSAPVTAARQGSRAVLLADQAAASVATRLAELAGRTVHTDLATVPRSPWRLDPVSTTVVSETITDELLEVAYRGASLAIVADALSPRFADALGRVSTVCDWRAEPLLRVPPDDLDVLHGLANGATVAEIAARRHLSERTAHRRLTSARRVLGVATTAEAVAAFVAVTARWPG